MPRRTPALRASQAEDFLLEIGTEELPAAYLGPAIEQFRRDAETLLRDAHLEYQQIRTTGTPRRLVLCVTGLKPVRRMPPEEIRGPSKHAAFDAQGKPTKALEGFLRSRGGTVNEIKTVTTDKGEYVYLLKPEQHTATATILPELIESLITRLRFPKTMRWDESGVRFARPIRWLLALYGRQVLRVRIGRLVAGHVTILGGPKRPRAVTVSQPSAYFALLKRADILLDAPARMARVDALVRQTAKQRQGDPAPEMLAHGLLDEVAALVEQPVAMAGAFDTRYLALPREVLLASMAKHQRIFATQDRRGKLLPQFVAILDGHPHKPTEVCNVMQRVLDARLADSLMFWNEDHKRLPLEQMAKDLSGVTFHEQLGSMAKKSDRLCELSVVLKDAWGLSSEEYKQLFRACELAKADLVSSLVKEFPALQGVVGKYYANDSGEPQGVGEAIEEHYLPIGNRLPNTLIGRALAILDKFDTLASYCSIGIMPTGDQDPFGLRRAAQGIVEVAWTVHRPLPVDQLLHSAATALSLDASTRDNILFGMIRSYLFDRLHTFAWPAPVPSADWINAVFHTTWNDLVDAMDRIQTLQRLEGHPGLLKAAKVVERTYNILKGVTTHRRNRYIDPSLLKEAPERALWDLYNSNKDSVGVGRLIDEKAYDKATLLFGDVFFTPLHQFFDQVLVNVDDEPLRQNRLALMRAINTLYTERIADLSHMTVPPSSPKQKE